MAHEGWTLDDREAAAEAIRRLGEEDLRYLNRLIVDRLKLISQARSTLLLARFSVGQQVTFQAPSGAHKTGIILKLNKKTATIQTDDGDRWNVHPTFLSQVAGRDGEIERRGRRTG